MDATTSIYAYHQSGSPPAVLIPRSGFLTLKDKPLRLCAEYDDSRTQRSVLAQKPAYSLLCLSLLSICFD